MKRRRGARVPSTYSAPLLTAPPRCAKCDDLLAKLEHPEQLEIPDLSQLVKFAERVPKPGTMVKAKMPDGSDVWACPYHASMERHVGRTRRGRQTVEWRVVPRSA